MSRHQQSVFYNGKFSSGVVTAMSKVAVVETLGVYKARKYNLSYGSIGEVKMREIEKKIGMLLVVLLVRLSLVLLLFESNGSLVGSLRN